MATVHILLESAVAHLRDDEDFIYKLCERMEKSNGWSFTIVHKGQKIGVTPIDENDTRKVYLEEVK